MLGSDIVVSMRNMVQYGMSSPTFYRVEERDIEMPVQSRLQVDITDYQEVAWSEQLIGSTIVDLEDRWHSPNWKASDEKRRIPTENRPLFNQKMIGQNCGNIEMWVEMIDSVKASDRKCTELRRPPITEIEVRLVIWTTKGVKCVDGDHVDVKLGIELSSPQYNGEKYSFPKLQFTDVHLNSTTGDSVFNWRVVFPHIVMPTKSCTMEIQVMDANFIAGDTQIGAVSIDIRKYVEKVAKDMDMLSTDADLAVFAPGGIAEDGPGDGEAAAAVADVGRVQFTMQVMTQSEANQKQAGKGREEPNEYPQLVCPSEGRGWGDVFAGLAFEMPDFGLMKKLLPLIFLVLGMLVFLRWLKLL